MSSYLLLFQVLLPSQVQTKFKKKSNRFYMAEITLFCYVLGTPVNSAILVNIGNITKVDGLGVILEKLNFGHIKKLIWPNNNKANELKLRKFVTPLEEDNETLKELNKKFNENIELSDELSPSTKFLNEFPVRYKFLNNHIHIIVQPPLPTTTEKQHLTKRLKLVVGSEDPFNGLLEVVAYLKSKSISQEETFWKSTDFIHHPTGKILAVIQQPVLYVRKAYKELYDKITKEGYNPKFLISGTSGVGKSCFLLYLIIRLLCSKNVTIVFQTIQSEFFYCYKDSKLEVGTLKDVYFLLYNPNTWYIVDAIPPFPKLTAITVLAVSSISYRQNNNLYDEFSKVVVNKFCMGIREELIVCRENVFSQVPEELMLKIYDEAGGVPRYVLEMPANLVGQTKDEEVILQQSLLHINEAISDIENFDQFLQCFTNKAEYIKISSCIIYQWPDASYNYDSHSLHWASNKVYNKVMTRLQQFRWATILQKIQNPFNPSNARGILFELYVLNVFKNAGSFKTRCLENKNTVEQYQIPGFNKYKYFQTPENLSNYNEDNISLLYPAVKNYGAIDLVVFPDKLFQITVSEKHSIKQIELIKTVENMPAFKSGNKIRLYFIVPDDIYDNYMCQNYLTSRNDKDKDNCQGEVNNEDLNDLMFRQVKRTSTVLEQWVLKIDLSL